MWPNTFHSGLTLSPLTHYNYDITKNILISYPHHYQLLYLELSPESLGDSDFSSRFI